MGSDGHRYREHLYHVRSHPAEVPEDFVDRRDSFLTVYLSILPFLAAEYFSEANYESMPSGLVFPLGYLLFWAFYYTYYKPGYLEDQLTGPKKWDVSGVPAILLGVMIWFVKVTVVELSTFLFGRWLIEHRRQKIEAAKKAAEARAHRHHHRRHHHHSHHQTHHTNTGHTQTHSGSFSQSGHTHSHSGQTHSHAGYAHSQTHTPPPPPKHHPSLPRDIVAALGALGLSESCADWNEIHKRYRELAKQYHPDLNHEITAIGRRFMIIDAAYRKLGLVKTRYFVKRDHAS